MVARVSVPVVTGYSVLSYSFVDACIVLNLGWECDGRGCGESSEAGRHIALASPADVLMRIASANKDYCHA